MKKMKWLKKPWIRKTLYLSIFVTICGAVFAAVTWMTLVDAVRGDIVVVPDVIGLPLPEARAKLAEAGLKSEVGSERSVYSDFVPRGAVAVQDPAPESHVKFARQVEIILSRGSRKESIPDLTGLNVEEAAEVVRSYQMRLTGIARMHDKRPAGTVIAQTPAAGGSGIVDNRIKLLVSEGELPVRYVMPDLTMRPLTEVEDLLRSNHMQYIVKTFANQIEDRNILFIKQQYPLPGHMMVADDIVTLKVVEREAL